MSFSGRTPESLLPRSDSKNPATTCKGITTNGRPCRRASAGPSPKSSPLPSPSRGHGVLAVLNNNDAAAFYCWQHKDQAESLAKQPGQHTTLYPLQERSSLDTLVDRVGIINLDEEVTPPQKVHHRKRRRSGEPAVTRRDTLPPGWYDMQSPLMTVPEEVKQDRPSRHPGKSEYEHGRSNVKFSWACCLRVDDDDREARRPRPTREARPSHQGYSQPSQMAYQPQGPTLISPARRKQVPSPGVSFRPPPNVTSTHNAPTSETQTLLSLIPETLSPQVTSSLLAELSRPLSPHDEAGYIYIFWLTPDSDTSPDDETASSLFDDDPSSPIRTNRREAAIQRYAPVRRPSQSLVQPKRSIMLKIGRAQNVHRRMSQWSKQCGQSITLIRYYPHQSKSTHFDTSTSPRKVPNVARVERLIHLELSDKKAIKDKCEQCSREHREWFEVEASREGLRGVDDVVRSWVNWGERQAEATTSGRQDHAAERKRRIHDRAWGNADHIGSDAWREPKNIPAPPTRQGNERGGYF